MFVLNLIFVLVCATSISGSKVCELTDSDCLLKAVQEHFQEAIAGRQGEWDTSDPLKKELIEGETSDLSYKFTEVVLTGMKDCTPELVTLNEPEYNYYIRCPKLYGEAQQYSMKGKIGDVSVDGEGSVTATLVDYLIKITGEYETFDGQDGKTHLKLKDSTVTFECDGNVNYSFGNLIKDDQEKSDAANKQLNEDWKVLNEIIAEPHMTVLIKIFIENTNGHLNAEPMDTLFSTSD